MILSRQFAQWCVMVPVGVITLFGCASGRDVQNHKELEGDAPRFNTEPDYGHTSHNYTVPTFQIFAHMPDVDTTPPPTLPTPQLAQNTTSSTHNPVDIIDHSAPAPKETSKPAGQPLTPTAPRGSIVLREIRNFQHALHSYHNPQTQETNLPATPIQHTTNAPRGLQVLQELKNEEAPLLNENESTPPQITASPQLPITRGQQVLHELRMPPSESNAQTEAIASDNTNLEKSAAATAQKFDTEAVQQMATEEPSIYFDETPVPIPELEEDDVVTKKLTKSLGSDFAGDTSGTKVLWPENQTPNMKSLNRANWQRQTFSPIDGRTTHYSTYRFGDIPLGKDKADLLDNPSVEGQMSEALSGYEAGEWDRENRRHLVLDPFRDAFNVAALPFRMLFVGPFKKIKSPYEPFEDDLSEKGW
ncbi:hypothetical protein [Poriferisphaera sp. WC338]|uniref:hypothetical protein n=1 Tax=Poriferisphaera sp. WC338 TaxID=3425129 RepID=UPI003D81846C